MSKTESREITQASMDEIYPPDENDRREGYIKISTGKLSMYVFLTHDKKLVVDSDKSEYDIFVPVYEFKPNVHLAPGDKVLFTLVKKNKGWRGIDTINHTFTTNRVKKLSKLQINTENK